MHAPRSPSWRFAPSAVAAMLFLASGLVALARVYTTEPVHGNLTSLFAALDARVSYTAPITLNDGHGDLVVYDVHQPLDEVMGVLGKAMTERGLHHAGGNLAYGLIHGTGEVWRIVLTQPDPERRTVAFTVHQSLADFQASCAPPQQRPADALPPFPGSLPKFLAEDLRSGMRLAVASATASSDEIESFYAKQLAGAGWKPLYANQPESADLTPHGFRMYARGDELYGLMVVDAADGRGATITVLHKRVGVK